MLPNLTYPMLDSMFIGFKNPRLCGDVVILQASYPGLDENRYPQLYMLH